MIGGYALLYVHHLLHMPQVHLLLLVKGLRIHVLEELAATSFLDLQMRERAY